MFGCIPKTYNVGTLVKERRMRRLSVPIKSEMNAEDRTNIIKGISRYGDAILEKYPSYIIRDEDGNIPLSVLCHLMSIYNIDTVKQRFECKMLIQMKWSVSVEVLNGSASGGVDGVCIDGNVGGGGDGADALRELTSHPLSISELCQELDYGDLWRPDLDFVNNFSELKILENKTRTFYKKGRDVIDVVWTLIIQGQFFEKFEVNYFPFDNQRLQIYIIFKNCPYSVLASERERKKSLDRSRFGSKKSGMGGEVEMRAIPHIADRECNEFNRERRVVFEEAHGLDGGEHDSDVESFDGRTSNNTVAMDIIRLPGVIVLRNEGIAIYKENFVQSDSWRTNYDNIELRQGHTFHNRDEAGLSFTTMRIVMEIERKFGFYFWNIVFPTFILVDLSFVSFLFQEKDLTDRLTVTLTLILTMFALKFAVSQYIPPTNYLTLLDRYIVTSYIMLALVALQNVICRMIDDGHSANIFNRVTAIMIMAFWFSMNLGTTCLIWNYDWRRSFIRNIGNREENEVYKLEKRVNGI